MHIYYFLCMQNVEAIMVRVSVDNVINGHGTEIGSKDKNARLGPTSRSFNH